MGTVQKIEQFLYDSWTYLNTSNPEPENLKLKAMKPVLSGEKRFYIHADGKREMIESINLLKRHGLNNIVIVGAKDAFYIMDFLKDQEVPVLLKDIHRLPGRDEEDIDMPFKLPYYLSEKGIKVGLTFGGSLQSTRNLPFYAGTAAAYGLGKEEALKMITSNTAEILGILANTGTLTEGKDANIIVSDGDALDMRSNNIIHAFIIGKKVNLEGRQQILFERYKEKYSEQ
jgi:imidazolonepropionase-like amidohydrolase